MWQKDLSWRVCGWLCAAGLLTACGTAATRQEVKVKGSDTVLPIAQQFVEQYKAVNPSAVISVTGGGSGVGIAALLNQTTDLAMASRRIKLSEKLKLKEAHIAFGELTVAYDALAVCVHPSNPVQGLTRQQLEGLYTGQITNWQEVGGPNLRVVAYSRENSSGTHEFFKEMVLDGREFAPTALMLPATGAVIQSVSQTPGAIGYVGLAYLEKTVKALPVSYDGGKTYVAPTLENALNETYPIVRPLYFYYAEADYPRLQPFLDYISGPAGRAIVRATGFVPTAEATKANAATEATDSTQTPTPAHGTASH